MIPNDITLLAFVAGFIEGDGAFTLSNGKYGQVSAAQKDPEVLEKLVEYCGGNLTPYTSKTGQVYYTWRLSGTAGYELAEALRPFMTTRRQRQIDKMLEGRTLRSYNIDPDFCPKGHQEFGEKSSGHRYCLACNRERYHTKYETGKVGQPRTELTHCPKGHEYTPENTYLKNGKWKECRTCTRVSKRDCERRRRAQALTE